MTSLTERFHAALADQNLLRKGERILAACSGGPDSTALLHLLVSLSSVMKWKLAVVHMDHGLRQQDSSRDRKFVERLAADYQIPCYSAKRPVREAALKNHESLEEAARAVRYAYFIEIARQKKFRKVVLAHTLDDQAETVLMRIVQGTGLRGLHGIRLKMTLQGIAFVRPFLFFRKKEILRYLKENRLAFCTDQSNRSVKFLRNRIRLGLMPQLESQYNPRIAEALARIPAIVEEENRLLSDLQKAAWKKTFRSFENRQLNLNRIRFLKYPAPLQFRILENAV